MIKYSGDFVRKVCSSARKDISRSTAFSSAHRFVKDDMSKNYSHPYFSMYPWKTLDQLAQIIHQSIAYEDENLVFIDKPWGLGIHEPYPKIHAKNSHIVDWASGFGDPKFCLGDVMPLLREKMRCPTLTIARALHRYESGLLVLGKTPAAGDILKACKARSRKGGECFAYYLAICRGTPTIKGDALKEKVALRMLELDELGDHKEPVIEYNLSKTHIKKYQLLTADMEIKILDSNKKLATSFVEIGTNDVRRQFIRAYAASKASFVLGDVQYASRVKQILGVPVSVRPNKIGYDNYEPLHQKVRGLLSVPSNRNIPLLNHLHRMKLRGKKGGPPTIEVYSEKLPLHFTWTLEQLDLSFDRDSHHLPDEES